MKALLGRKFIIALVALIPGALLAAFGSLTAEYVTLALGIVGAFNTADTLITRQSFVAGLPPTGRTKHGEE